MSDTGVQIMPPDNPTPQLPGQVQINPPTATPGSTVTPAPVVPQINQPSTSNVPASFNMMTDAITQLAAAKGAEISASVDALKANTAIDAASSKQISGYQQSTIDAYGKIQQTDSLPGGAGGKIAKILSLFDSDYNVQKQKDAVTLNTLKGQQVADTAAAIKTQNNAMPTLLGKVSEAQQAIFNAQMEQNKLVLQGQTLTDEQNKTKIQAAELRLHMTEADRAATEFKLRGMTTDQIQAALPMAAAGKGPWAGKAGLLQDRLTTEEQATTSLGIAQNELAKGNRQGYNDALADTVSHLPVDLVTQAYQEAQKSGAPFVNLPTGQKDAKGGMVMMPIPLDIIQQGIIKNTETQNQVNKSLAANIVQRTSMMPKVNNVITTASAFASADPRATSIQMQLGQAMHGLDPNNPQQALQMSTIVDNYQAQMDEVVKDQAAKMSTPEAKAGVISYGKTGKFDNVGGTAVAADSVTIPSLSTNSLYKNAWSSFANTVASKVASSGGSGSAAIGAADTMQEFAQALAANKGKEKIGTIAQEVLSDPAQAKMIGRQMTGAIQTKVVNDVISGLSQQKDANPVWKQIDSHPEQYTDKNGAMDYGKIMNQLQIMTTTSGGKINYGMAFLSAMRNYGLNAENQSASDPSYTVQDHALEAAIFGGNPYRNITADLYGKFASENNRANAEMKARIQSDLSGATQRQAVTKADPLFEEYPGPTDNPVFQHTTKQQVFKRTGVNLDNVPSSTGTGMTVAQIQALFGGGN